MERWVGVGGWMGWSGWMEDGLDRVNGWMGKQ